MSTTVITHPDGTTTVIRKTGFLGGCFNTFLIMIVLLLPLTLGLPLAILAYVILAVIAGLVIFGLRLKHHPGPPPLHPRLRLSDAVEAGERAGAYRWRPWAINRGSSSPYRRSRRLSRG